MRLWAECVYPDFFHSANLCAHRCSSDEYIPKDHQVAVYPHSLSLLVVRWSLRLAHSSEGWPNPNWWSNPGFRGWGDEGFFLGLGDFLLRLSSVEEDFKRLRSKKKAALAGEIWVSTNTTVENRGDAWIFGKNQVAQCGYNVSFMTTKNKWNIILLR